jgi:hypothetical protein
MHALSDSHTWVSFLSGKKREALRLRDGPRAGVPLVLPDIYSANLANPVLPNEDAHTRRPTPKDEGKPRVAESVGSSSDAAGGVNSEDGAGGARAESNAEEDALVSAEATLAAEATGARKEKRKPYRSARHPSPLRSWSPSTVVPTPSERNPAKPPPRLAHRPSRDR